MKPTTSILTIRPHHGLCMQFFAGEGYSNAFVANMKTTLDWLNDNPDTPFMLLSETDIICGHCPNKIGNQCKTQEKVARYDRLCLQLCGFENISQTTWNIYSSAVKVNIIEAGKLDEVCSDCEWHSSCLNHPNYRPSKAER